MACASLLAAAAPGTVLMSDTTHALTRHRFSFEPGGELALRSKSEALIVHQLVNRTDELDQLKNTFDRMQRDRTQAVNLVGEAGTGKSRLIAELFAQLESEGR